MNQLPTSLAPKTMAEAMEFSKLISQSSMVPAAYKGKPADVLVAVQWGAELGLAPLQALQNIATINGKPSVYGDAALALVRGSTVCEDVEEIVEGEGDQMIATCIAKRKGCKPVVAKFSVLDAKAAGLWKKQGPWSQYPRRMLQMRARGFALRDAFPDVLKGLITAEEAQDYPRQEKDVTPSNPLDKYAAKVVESIEAPHVEPVIEDAPAPIEGEVVTESSDHKFLVTLPGGEVANACETPDAYVESYLHWLERIEGSQKIPLRERMTKMREFKEANQSTAHLLKPAYKARIAKHYATAIRRMGAGLEEGGDAS